MLLDDRFVGTFGIVAAGDRELITKVAVDAARKGFGVVPMQADGVNPACALGVRDAKKEHDCYHVMTEDTKVRAAFNRLTKDGAVCNLAIDLAASNIAVATDVSWWVGPEISPTLIGLDGEKLYVFDLTDVDVKQVMPISEFLTLDGILLVPPTADDEAGDHIQLIGQMNSINDNVAKEETEMADEGVPDTLWNNDAQDYAEMSERVEALGYQINELTEGFDRLKEALVVALTTIKELKDAAAN